MGDLEAVAAELLLFGHALAVGGEVSEQVRPAELPLVGVEVVVAAPAVGADDPGEALAEQRPGLEAVTSGSDPEHRGLAGQRAPERAVAAGGLPAGLVDVDDRGCLDPLLEPVYGPASASPARCTIVSTEPVASSTPNSSRASSVVSRRETRLRTVSVTTAACNLGPNADRDTPAGSSARVSAAQPGQRSRCRRCSVTVTAIGGSSATCWHCTAAASARSSSANTCAQAWQRSGQCSTTSSPARAEAGVGVCPGGRAGRPASGPNPASRRAAAPTADPATAAATSSANSGSAAAQARPPAPRAAGSPRPAHPPASATRPPSPGRHPRSPRPRHAPRHPISPPRSGSLPGT